MNYQTAEVPNNNQYPHGQPKITSASEITPKARPTPPPRQPKITDIRPSLPNTSKQNFETTNSNIQGNIGFQEVNQPSQLLPFQNPDQMMQTPTRTSALHSKPPLLPRPQALPCSNKILPTVSPKHNLSKPPPPLLPTKPPKPVLIKDNNLINI